MTCKDDDLLVDKYDEEMKFEYNRMIKNYEQDLVNLQKEFKGARQKYAGYLAKKRLLDEMQNKGFTVPQGDLDFEKIFKVKGNEFLDAKKNFIEKKNYIEECIATLRSFLV